MDFPLVDGHLRNDVTAAIERRWRPVLLEEYSRVCPHLDSPIVHVGFLTFQSTVVELLHDFQRVPPGSALAFGAVSETHYRLLFSQFTIASYLYWIHVVPIYYLKQIMNFGLERNHSLVLDLLEQAAWCWSYGLCWIEYLDRCWATCSQMVPGLFPVRDSDLQYAPEWPLLLLLALAAERFAVIWTCRAAPIVDFASPSLLSADKFSIAVSVFVRSSCRLVIGYL